MLHVCLLKPLVKFYILSLTFRLELSVKFEVRKIKFGLKKEREVIFQRKLSNVHFLKPTRRISWIFDLQFLGKQAMKILNNVLEGSFIKRVMEF